MYSKVTDSVYYIGTDDKTIDLFESQYVVPNGVSYNSYLIMDEKVAVMDTVDPRAEEAWFANLEEALGGRKPDYLVISHLEPDHAGNIQKAAEKYPDMKLVSNAKVFAFLPQFFDLDLTDRCVTVKEGDTLSLGSHTLAFVMAPMVHWPEVMVSWEETDKILFSADAFGSFGALNGNIFNDELNFDRDWLADARRYYTNIVGKYGPQVQNALKKLSALEIQMICPLHGPIWRSDLGYLLDKYDKWSRYEPEDKAVAIMYASMYGNTENAANVLAAELAEAGVKNIAVYDVSNTHVSELIAEVFRCSHLVLASPTYNNGIYPAMLNLLHDMKALNVQNRTVALMENGSWAPSSAKQVRALLDEMKGMEILEPVVTVKSALKEDSMNSLRELADTLVKSLNA